VGVVPDTGTLDVRIPVPASNGFAGRSYYFQVLVTGPNGNLLSNLVAEILRPTW
jgi:hypothetical protein